MPIYAVTDNTSGEVRLVKAKNPAAALKHATKPFSAAVATPDELVELTLKGVKVEDAGEQEAQA